MMGVELDCKTVIHRTVWKPLYFFSEERVIRRTRSLTRSSWALAQDLLCFPTMEVATYSGKRVAALDDDDDDDELQYMVESGETVRDLKRRLSDQVLKVSAKTHCQWRS